MPGLCTHNFVLRHQIDIAVVTETWLTMRWNQALVRCQDIPTRQERTNKEDREVMWLCLQAGVQTHTHWTEMPPSTKVEFQRVVMVGITALLLCARYFPSGQDPASIDFLTQHLDDLLRHHCYKYVLIVSNLNLPHGRSCLQ